MKADHSMKSGSSKEYNIMAPFFDHGSSFTVSKLFKRHFGLDGFLVFKPPRSLSVANGASPQAGCEKKNEQKSKIP